MQLQSAFPTTLLCRLRDLSRSSYYSSAHPRDDSALEQQLRTVSGTYPTYRAIAFEKDESELR